MTLRIPLLFTTFWGSTPRVGRYNLNFSTSKTSNFYDAQPAGRGQAGSYPASWAIQGWVWIPSWEVHISRIIGIFLKMIFLFGYGQTFPGEGKSLTPRRSQTKLDLIMIAKIRRPAISTRRKQFSPTPWGLYTACQEFGIRVLGVLWPAMEFSAPLKKTFLQQNVLKIPWLASKIFRGWQVKRNHLKLKHMASHMEPLFFPRFVFTPKTLSAARLNLSKWSSYDVPKARGLHLHSLGGNPGGPRMGRWMRGKFYMVQPKITYFYSEM